MSSSVIPPSEKREPKAPRAPSTAPASAREISPRLLLGIVLVATLMKIGLIGYLGGRLYGDTHRALNFGALVAHGSESIRSVVINDKTFIGPLLWYGLYRHAGVAGLTTFNVLCFLALCAAGYRLGRDRYDGPTRAIALLLFAFYVGTHRNIVAGEPDDNLAALLFTVGVLTYLEARRPLLAGLAMGVGFLFKFWIPIFAIGFALFLVRQRLWRDLGWALAGMALPFLLVNLVDGMASFRCLLISIDKQHGFSNWSSLGFKLFSTGLLPMAVVTTLVWWRRRTEFRTLFWLLSIVYPAYVVLNRDAFAASFVLMLSMVFGSFLLAEGLQAIVRRLPRRMQSGALASVLATYLLVTSAVTYHNLYRDAQPVVLNQDPAQTRHMFGVYLLDKP